MSSIKIGNAGGFWGDDPTAPLRLAQQVPDLDVLTIDYLAEVSLSILAKQRDRGGSGYPKDAIAAVRSLAPLWRDGRTFKLVTNGGGLDPAGAIEAAAAVLAEEGVTGRRLACVYGDDVLSLLLAHPEAPHFRHLEADRPLTDILDRLVTANAYVGAGPAAQALAAGADVMLTGRMADPSMAVAAAMAYFSWDADDWNKLAGATVAGHLIECGQQACGGISTDWLELADCDCGYPVVEVNADGSCVLTKPGGTGGRVDELTVKEQLLYELGDPANYLSPDCSVSFLKLDVEHKGTDRVAVRGATGRPPTAFYKVSATYRAGWRCVGSLTIVGEAARAKAERAGRLVLDRLERAARRPARERVEVIGGEREVVLRVAAADDDRSLCETFGQLIMPLVCGGPPGTTGYAEGRPPVREVFGYWPCLIPREDVRLKVTMQEVR